MHALLPLFFGKMIINLLIDLESDPCKLISYQIIAQFHAKYNFLAPWYLQVWDKSYSDSDHQAWENKWSELIIVFISEFFFVFWVFFFAR